MVKAAAANGWLDERAAVLEVLTGSAALGQISSSRITRRTLRRGSRAGGEGAGRRPARRGRERGRGRRGARPDRRRRDDVARPPALHAAPRVRRARDSASLIAALEAAGFASVLYEDVNDPAGVALLTLSEAPEAFVSEHRSFLQSSLFAELDAEARARDARRTYAIGYEQDLEETLVDGRGAASSTRLCRGRSGTRFAAPACSSSSRAASRTPS